MLWRILRRSCVGLERDARLVKLSGCVGMLMRPEQQGGVGLGGRLSPCR